MNHYFEPNSHLKHKRINITYSYKSTAFTFTSDIGVFSKDNVDYGTDILLANISELSGSLLDMGCGYGCIGIVLGKIYKGSLEVTMSDVNDRAVELAKINADINGVKADIIRSDGFTEIIQNFDTITLNPPIHAGKSIIYGIYQGAYEHLYEGGSLYIVIQKKHGALSHREKLAEIFGENNCLTLYSKKGFFVFQMKKVEAKNM